MSANTPAGRASWLVPLGIALVLTLSGAWSLQDGDVVEAVLALGLAAFCALAVVSHLVTVLLRTPSRRTRD